MRLSSFILLFCFVSALTAQVEYHEIESSKLEQKRQLKIQLPRNYADNVDKNYPIIVALDGDYLFEPVAGNVDYNGYWEEMPEAIVIGVVQDNTREDDTYYDEETYLPSDKGAAFFEFLGLEMMPWLDANYRTANFRIIVGHDLTANFMNYYLFKEPSLFQGYISISPELAPRMGERLVERLSAVKEKIFYYLATSSDDIKGLRLDIEDLNTQLKTISNEQVRYNFDNFEGATHYSLVGRAIPKALEEIFSIYRPISRKEYKEVISKLPGSPYDYLIDKYATVEELFGIEDKIRVNDFTAVFTAIKKKKDWESLEKLGKLAKAHHPDTMLGNFYLAMSLEEKGEPKKAMKTYQSAFLLEEVGDLTKDLMLDKADKIKQDFGY